MATAAVARALTFLPGSHQEPGHGISPFHEGTFRASPRQPSEGLDGQKTPILAQILEDSPVPRTGAEATGQSPTPLAEGTTPDQDDRDQAKLISALLTTRSPHSTSTKSKRWSQVCPPDSFQDETTAYGRATLTGSAVPASRCGERRTDWRSSSCGERSDELGPRMHDTVTA